MPQNAKTINIINYMQIIKISPYVFQRQIYFKKKNSR